MLSWEKKDSGAAVEVFASQRGKSAYSRWEYALFFFMDQLMLLPPKLTVFPSICIVLELITASILNLAEFTSVSGCWSRISFLKQIKGAIHFLNFALLTSYKYLHLHALLRILRVWKFC